MMTDGDKDQQMIGRQLTVFPKPSPASAKVLDVLGKAVRALDEVIEGEQATIERIETERNEALKELDALRRNPDIDECPKGHLFRTIASHPAKSEREWECPHCAVMERDEALAENARLRAIFPRILQALGSGACTDGCSVEFYEAIPGEVEKVVARLKGSNQKEVLDAPRRTYFPELADGARFLHDSKSDVFIGQFKDADVYADTWEYWGEENKEGVEAGRYGSSLRFRYADAKRLGTHQILHSVGVDDAIRNPRDESEKAAGELALKSGLVKEIKSGGRQVFVLFWKERTAE